MTESKIQSDCVVWLWNTRQETRGLFFAVTNNSENIGRAMQRKAVGLVPGVSDCLLIWEGTVYCFEFKTESGRQSSAQIEWMQKVTTQGINYYLVRSLEQFKKIINEIL